MTRRPALLLSLAACLMVAGIVPGRAETTETSVDIALADPVPYVRIYTDADGETHFSDERLTFQLVDFAPPAPPISVSELFAAKNVGFISSPAGWDGDWHPTPRRQFVLMLRGVLEVEVSAGEVRRLQPGDLCLVEDTTGRGHVSRVVGPVRVLAAAIPLADE